MINEASRWRLRFARRLAPVYAGHPAVRAVIVGGSAAEGHADRYSDVELGVFWERQPSDDERRAAAERAGASKLTLDAYDSRRDEGIEDYFVDQVNVDVVHRTIDGTEQLLGDVIERYDPALHKQIVIHALRHAVPLLDAPLLAQWQRRTQVYPDALLRAVVEQQLRLKPWWSVEALAERRSLITVHYAVCMVAERLVAALMAMNRRYYAGVKWLPLITSSLTIAPPALGERLERCFHGALPDRVALAGALVEETLDLADRHVPGLDVEPLRAAFFTRRPPVDAPPPDVA